MAKEWKGVKRKKLGKPLAIRPGPAKAGGPKAVQELFWVDLF
ncbi:hypothetical protein [Ottowia sp. oral taxon 894]|jgi:hypothetical protein|nr:hypothetical protein [Ottowia sp. oral taxon 894]